MDIELLTENQLTKITVKVVPPKIEKQICQSMTKNLPEWLCTPEAKTKYEENAQNRKCFVAYVDDQAIGMMSIEFGTANNAHIDRFIVNHAKNLESIGSKLLLAAENYCYEQGYSSVTVETLNSKAKNKTHLNNYQFFEKSGYKPLFEMYTYDKDHMIIYMQKMVSLNDFIFIDLTHSLSSDVPHWGVDVGFKYNSRYIQSPESAGELKFRVQRLEMSSGIGTHMDAPSHCFEDQAAIDNIPIQSLITICRVINVSNKVHDSYSITVEDIHNFENKYGIIPKGAFVILYTGWDQRWNEPEKYRNEKVFPSISTAAAEMLLSRDIVGIGIDTLSPDAFGSNFPVHQLILGAGKYIIENVANANQLDPTGNFIFALPIKVTGGTEAPMRLIGMKLRKGKI